MTLKLGKNFDYMRRCDCGEILILVGYFFLKVFIRSLGRARLDGVFLIYQSSLERKILMIMFRKS